jgi:two-component system cell cycle response regulator DivK
VSAELARHTLSLAATNQQSACRTAELDVKLHWFRMVGTKPRVLLVNCFRDEREMYLEYLQYAGFASAQECGADDAFAAARAVRPDVIVTDLALPGHGDGIDFIRQLRAHPDTAHTCIVVVSGFVMREFQERATAAGADVFLIKPCLPEDLVRELRRVLATRRQHPCGA